MSCQRIPLVLIAICFGPAAVALAAETPQTGRAKAVLREGGGALRGTVRVTEYVAQSSLDSRIDVVGMVTGLEPSRTYGLHLRAGDCSSPGGHVDFTGNGGSTAGHPRHEGDLPNVTADANGRIQLRLLKVTNRFLLSDDPLNVFRAGPVSVSLDQNPSTASTFDTTPILCGELRCETGACVETAPPSEGLRGSASYPFPQMTGALDLTVRSTAPEDLDWFKRADLTTTPPHCFLGPTGRWIAYFARKSALPTGTVTIERTSSFGLTAKFGPGTTYGAIVAGINSWAATNLSPGVGPIASLSAPTDTLASPEWVFAEMELLFGTTAVGRGQVVSTPGSPEPAEDCVPE